MSSLRGAGGEVEWGDEESLGLININFNHFHTSTQRLFTTLSLRSE